MIQAVPYYSGGIFPHNHTNDAGLSTEHNTGPITCESNEIILQLIVVKSVKSKSFEKGLKYLHGRLIFQFNEVKKHKVRFSVHQRLTFQIHN